MPGTEGLVKSFGLWFSVLRGTLGLMDVIRLRNLQPAYCWVPLKSLIQSQAVMQRNVRDPMSDCPQILALWYYSTSHGTWTTSCNRMHALASGHATCGFTFHTPESSIHHAIWHTPFWCPPPP